MPLTQFTFIKRRKSEIHIKNAVKIYLNYFRNFSPGNSLLPLFVFETEKKNKKKIFETELNVYFLLTSTFKVSIVTDCLRTDKSTYRFSIDRHIQMDRQIFSTPLIFMI